jgi:hypothetical protein
MPFSGSSPTKTYERSDGVRTGAAVCAQAKLAGANNTAALADARENDIADAINLTLTRDGSTQPSADLPMNSHRHTGVANATARTNYAAAGQVQDGALIYGGTAGGTANALTLDLTPSITAYAAGQMFLFVASNDNSSVDVTVNVDGLGAKALFRLSGTSKPAIGEIQSGGTYLIGYNGTAFGLLGLQDMSDNLQALSDLAGASGKVPMFTAAGTMTLVNRTDLGVPSGTKMIFQQTSAPTGWTKDTTHNDKALRVVSGTASSGGSVAFTTAFASKTPTGTVGGTAITEAQMPLHGHPYIVSTAAVNNPGSSTSAIGPWNNFPVNKSAYTGTPDVNIDHLIGGTGGGGTHTHTFTGDAINMAVNYVDVIIAIKD